ncbi:PIN domain-containing protein [Gordonia alkaliphila]|uniref:PIN domain-containing protein n=1 Tax=Gordonia alkaliphila TaxID=1053547 RepID=UPI001FF2298D|nr:PIN domain-containing protein [Gordonia alkaliphila]MCK0439979.1 PIN domain-containing protein [Gordonia alkaliphila]
MASSFRVVLDACVMLPQNLNNLLLTLAAHDLFDPVWTPDLLDEVERNLRKKSFGLTEDQIDRRITQMRRAFPHAEDHAAGYSTLVPSMKNHRKDRHVLAAAVSSSAALIVTANVRDFPKRACTPNDVEAITPDEFLLDQLDLDPDLVLGAMAELVGRNQHPPRSVLGLAESLGPLTPQFSKAVV